MGLHEEIAAVIDAASGRYEHADTDTLTTDVMGVVTSHLDGRRAYTERRMEWAREAEARVWERRMREEKEAADAALAELEEENKKLRALVGDLADDGTCWYDHHGYCQEHGWFATDPKCPHARAREITKGGT